MPMNRALRRTLARAVSLLATTGLVLALVLAGPSAMAGGVEMHGSAHAAPMDEDCDHHAAQHAATFHHPHVALIVAEADLDQTPGQPNDPSHHYHTHPCCVGGVSIVLPGLPLLQRPVSASGPRVSGDVAERLEKHAPEGPDEPPRTGDMS
jgi:hypothetical protein